MTATYPSLDISQIKSDTPIIIDFEDWTVQEMSLSWEKVGVLWALLERHKTLFSDFTRGDFDNYVRLLTQPDTYWLEIYKKDDHEIVGIVYFEGFSNIIDIKAHLVMLDRKPAAKVGLFKEIVRYMFATFPINRITAPTPSVYFATVRMLKKIGFKHEGTMHQSIRIDNKWADMMIFGILRNELADVIPIRSD